MSGEAGTMLTAPLVVTITLIDRADDVLVAAVLVEVERVSLHPR